MFRLLNAETLIVPSREQIQSDPYRLANYFPEKTNGKKIPGGLLEMVRSLLVVRYPERH